jgi:hypothetical protein
MEKAKKTEQAAVKAKIGFRLIVVQDDSGVPG